MKNLARRGLSLLLVLVMCLSLLPAIQTPAEAAVQNVTYVTGSTSQYSNIIKNWGKRGETATFLSQNAAAFYTGDNTYANFSAMDGATSTSSVSSSELYLALKSFMTSNHSNITSYDATRDLFAFTDCENSGLTTNSISCFYSAEAIGPAWDAGSTWNREHTWPKSKCIQEKANDGSDIMMLRPSKSSINSSRGNTAFGVTSGYYNPNKNLTDYDVRGDVARVLLYNYVRWGNTANMWDTDGVIESKEVLLDWMEADPVDTWELGRNDSVESITGTRNVFVDYPELAFALFNEDLPTDYTTPSGNALSTGGSYNVTFMQNGLVKDTAVSPVTLPAHYGTVPTGYNFEGWISYTITNETTTEPVFYAPGTSFSPTSDTTLHALYSMQAASSTSKWKLVTDASQLAVDASVIIAASGYNYALSTTQNKNNRGQASVTKNTTDQTLQPTADVAILTLEAGASSGTYAFNTGSGYLYAASSSSNYLRTQAAVDGNASWTITIADNQASIVANGTNTRKFMQYNQSSSLFACYSAASQKPLSLYILSADDTLAYTTSTCAHTNTTQKAEEPAKCEDPGRAAGVWCNDCESFIEGGNILAPSGHDYEAVVTPPTTTAQGYTTYTCKNDSSHSYVADYVDALSYTVSFSVPAGVAKPADVHCNSTAFNLPTPTGAPLGDLHEYSFVGWAEAAVDNQEEAPKLFTGKYSTDESITLYAIYSYTVGGSSSDFTLVTDASQLTLGASVIIAATDSNFALSTTQNNNNRGQAAVTKNTANNTLEPTTNVAILTLEEGKVSGTYAFNTGTGYLYAASSKSNHLKTQTTLNDNGSWLITVDSNGIATVKAQGTFYNCHNTFLFPFF